MAQTNQRLEPLFKKHQLLGASQMVRFASLKLGLQISRTGGVRHIGLCVSGQTISDLLKKIVDGFYPLDNKVIIHIGTNDILRGNPLKRMVEDFANLMDCVGRRCGKIILLAIVPIPRLEYSESDQSKITKFNLFLKDYAELNQHKCIFGSAFNLFVSNGGVMRKYFERSYDDGRTDLLHLNWKGFQRLLNFLNEITVIDNENIE